MTHMYTVHMYTVHMYTVHMCTVHMCTVHMYTDVHCTVGLTRITQLINIKDTYSHSYLQRMPCRIVGLMIEDHEVGDEVGDEVGNVGR